MPRDADGFNRSVSLPPELKIAHIREGIEHVEDKTSELVDIYFEQANVFSGIVGILASKLFMHSARTKNTSTPT